MPVAAVPLLIYILHARLVEGNLSERCQRLILDLEVALTEDFDLQKDETPGPKRQKVDSSASLPAPAQYWGEYPPLTYCPFNYNQTINPTSSTFCHELLNGKHPKRSLVGHSMGPSMIR